MASPESIVPVPPPSAVAFNEMERRFSLLELRLRRSDEFAFVNLEDTDKRLIGLEYELRNLRRRVYNLEKPNGQS